MKITDNRLESNLAPQALYYKDCSRMVTDGMGLVWDPHSKYTCAVGAGNDLKIVNTHNNDISLTIKATHDGCIR